MRRAVTQRERDVGLDPRNVVMAAQEHRRAQVCRGGELLGERERGLAVERAVRLVEQQHARSQREGEHEGKLLAHAAGVCRGRQALLTGKPKALEQALGARPGVLGAVGREHELQVLRWR